MVIEGESCCQLFLFYFSNKILSGELPPGASLPAIRVLAKDLGVSIITVKKAYELLQSQHLINSVVGKGTIISKLSSDFIEDSIRNQLEKKIDEVIKFGIEVGIDSKEIKEIILLKLDDNGEI